MLESLTKLQGKVHRLVIEHTMDYLFGLITKKELERDLTELGYPSLIELVNNGYILRNCKIYIYAKTKGRVMIKDYGIESVDKPLLDLLASHLTIKGCRPLTLSEIEQIESYFVSDLKTYIGKYVSKKMVFLIKSYGLTRADIESHLLYKGLVTFLKRYPYYESVLHAKNTVKTAIHNAGIDLITEHTTQKVNRLKKNSDGTFEQNLVDVSNMYHLEAPTPFSMRYYDERQTLNQLMLKMNWTGCKFIQLARGEYDQDFSEYIGLDNRIACEQNYKSYLKKIQRYLKVNNKQRDDWFNRLREHLR